MPDYKSIDMRNNRQHLNFDNSEYQEIYDALFELGEPGSPIPFDVNKAADLNKLGFITANRETGEEELAQPFDIKPEDTLKRKYVLYNQLCNRVDEKDKAEYETIAADPKRLKEETKKMENFLAASNLSYYMKALKSNPVLIANPDSGDYPMALKFSRDASTGKLKASLEEVPTEEPVAEKPVKPKKPGFWNAVIRFVSFGNIGRETHDNYKRQLKEYKLQLKAYHKNDSYRRVAKKIWPNYAEEGKRFAFRKKEQAHLQFAAENHQNYQKGAAAQDAFSRMKKAVNDDLTRIFRPAGDKDDCQNMMENILINGRTLKDIICEKIGKHIHVNNDIAQMQNYSDKLREQLKKVDRNQIAELTAAALYAGHQVKAFGVDDMLNWKTEPETLTLAKEELPKTTEEIIRNTVFHVLDNVGKEPEDVISRRTTEAEDLIRHKNELKNTATQNRGYEDLLLGKWMREHNRTKASLKEFGFSSDRSALMSIALAYLASEHNPKLSGRDLFDSTRYREMKAEAGSEVCRRIVNKDAKWLVKVITKGLAEINKSQADYLKATGLDISDKQALRKPENRWLFTSSHTLFDLGQEIKHVKPYMKEVYGDKANEEYETAVDYGCGYLSNVCTSTLNEIDAILGHQDVLTDAGKYTEIPQGEFIVMSARDVLEKLPDKRGTLKNTEICQFGVVVLSGENFFAEAYKANNKISSLGNRRRIAKWMYDGGLEKNIDIEMDAEKYDFQVKLKSSEAKKELDHVFQKKQAPVQKKNEQPVKKVNEQPVQKKSSRSHTL